MFWFVIFNRHYIASEIEYLATHGLATSFVFVLIASSSFSYHFGKGLSVSKKFTFYLFSSLTPALCSVKMVFVSLALMVHNTNTHIHTLVFSCGAHGHVLWSAGDPLLPPRASQTEWFKASISALPVRRFAIEPPAIFFLRMYAFVCLSFWGHTWQCSGSQFGGTELVMAPGPPTCKAYVPSFWIILLVLASFK